ncbi:MAG: 4-hydroxy-tetrahydrodipicolinate reductase [Bdellovibrionaceae bacterium]|nr:4-hydroxy-tetrahydrodipicolinate reductase [Pseudobdellovibrionaceae bacterium]
MKPLNVGVVGAAGKMGKELCQAIKDAGHVPFLGFYNTKQPEGFLHNSNSWQDKKNEEVELWIDFSLPDNFEVSLRGMAKYGKPIVSGTTGISDVQKNILKEVARQAPVLWSSNMSIGVAFVNKMLSLFSSIKDFDFQIEELHHKHKKDAPSGTAKTMQENLESAIGRAIPQTLSVRGGGIFGVHRIWAMSDQEVITIEHQALNRKVFAEGALKAGLSLMKKGPGLYSMKDIF